MPGIFVFVFLLILIRIKYSVKCLLSAEAIVYWFEKNMIKNASPQQKLNYFQYIVSSGRKEALRKTAYLPNRTCVGANLMYQIKVYIHPSHFWTRFQINSMHSTRKTPQKRTLKMSLRHLLVNLKNVRVLEPPMLCSIELSRQWQPLIFPPIQASDGSLRSVKHERRM